MDYVTSDWHLGHNNICGKDGFVVTRKSFANVEDMNETIITAINDVVEPNDTLYHLGDIAMNMKPKAVLDLLNSINCKLFLLGGNHDGSKLIKYLLNNNYDYADGVKFQYKEVGFTRKRSGKKYFFTHYPLQLGENRKKMRSICGHIHDEYADAKNCINVGIDSPELPQDLAFGTPITFDQAFDLVEEKYNLSK